MYISSASLPAVTHSCASATAPDFLDEKVNRDGVTKLLLQRMFIHCTMVLPFILSFYLQITYSER